MKRLPENYNHILPDMLEVAVPLWILRFNSAGGFPADYKQRLERISHVLQENGEAILYKVKGKSAESFNALAEGIALLSFCPGGVECFGRRWETPTEAEPEDEVFRLLKTLLPQ